MDFHQLVLSFLICCLRSLQWLRGMNKNIELELETIRSNIRIARPRQTPFPTLTTTGHLLSKTSMQTIYTNIKSVLKNVRIIKPVSITCGLMVFQRFTGMQVKPILRVQYILCFLFSHQVCYIHFLTQFSS